MRVCYICSEYPPVPHGGIGSVTQSLGRALVAHGHQVKVVGAYAESLAAPAPQLDEGVEVWRLSRPEARMGWIGARYRVFRQVADWARKGLIDIVECPDWEGWVAGWPTLNVPIVARLHGSISYFAAELRQQRRQTAYWLERSALRRADFWCSVSRYTCDKTRQLFAPGPSDTAVIYNSVDVAEEDGSAPRRPNHVVFSGTLTEKKGVQSLIRAWPAVWAKHADAVLHVYGKDTTRPGSPSMRAALQAHLPEAVRPSVMFHGHQPREVLLRHLRQAHAAVFPSHAEAFAMAPLEAMAQGCPTIYSILGSGPELIEDGRDGMLVDPADPPQIAQAINRLLDDPLLAGQLGRAGRRKVESNFSTKTVLALNEDFYSDCLGRFHSLNRS